MEILQRFQSKTLIPSEHILLHKQPQDPWRSTNVHIAQWNIKKNIKYLKKLENHTNALAVNLLDNSEITHRLKTHCPSSTR
jgi:hypothetical protein